MTYHFISCPPHILPPLDSLMRYKKYSSTGTLTNQSNHKKQTDFGLLQNRGRGVASCHQQLKASGPRRKSLSQTQRIVRRSEAEQQGYIARRNRPCCLATCFWLQEANRQTRNDNLFDIMGRYSSQQASSDERTRVVPYEQATRSDDTVSPAGQAPASKEAKEACVPTAPANYAPADSIVCDTPSLFVGNLHPRLSDLHLEKLFRPYGELLRIHIVTGSPPAETSRSRSGATPKQPPKHFAQSQKPRGYAFVEYKSVASAKLAISRLNGRQLLGKPLAVRPSHRKPNETAGAKNPNSTRKECAALESRIEAVKKAIEQKKKGI